MKRQILTFLTIILASLLLTGCAEIYLFAHGDFEASFARLEYRMQSIEQTLISIEQTLVVISNTFISFQNTIVSIWTRIETTINNIQVTISNSFTSIETTINNSFTSISQKFENITNYITNIFTPGKINDPNPDPIPPYKPPSEKNLYMIIDITSGDISYKDKVPRGGWSEEYKTKKLVLRRIEQGTFTMGSPEDELGRKSNETQREVTISEPFYIGVFEITQDQYYFVTKESPSQSTGKMRPVESVKYSDIKDNNSGFLKLLSRKTGKTFDLPTEAQWEYACRAGSKKALNNNRDIASTKKDDNLKELGRYMYNQDDGKGGFVQHTVVGSYKPNAWGLYDMHGNVQEWCLDIYRDEQVSGDCRVLRGGSWDDDAWKCRSARRDYRNTNFPSSKFGFRAVLVQE